MTKTTQTPAEIQNQAGREKIFPVGGGQAAVALGDLAGFVADRKYLLKNITLKVLDAGSANTTTLIAQVNGVAVPGASASIINTAANGTKAPAVPTAETILNPGDSLLLSISAIATAATFVVGTAYLAEVYD